MKGHSSIWQAFTLRNNKRSSYVQHITKPHCTSLSPSKPASHVRQPHSAISLKMASCSGCPLQAPAWAWGAGHRGGFWKSAPRALAGKNLRKERLSQCNGCYLHGCSDTVCSRGGQGRKPPVLRKRIPSPQGMWALVSFQETAEKANSLIHTNFSFTLEHSSPDFHWRDDSH